MSTKIHQTLPNSMIWLFIVLLVVNTNSHSMTYGTTQLLDPNCLEPYIFKTQISGKLNPLIPIKQQVGLNGAVIKQEYVIEMKKIQQQILPSQLFNKTTIYAYGGQTKNGYSFSFPGPAVFATKNVPVRITWRNLIDGPHILPVDFTPPFMSTPQFKTQVPTIPHVHGVAALTKSDGQPEAHWTKKGIRSPGYSSVVPSANNQAIFEYPNEQQGGNNWYHDHTMGITRLNVYAGLAGFYKINDPYSLDQVNIMQKYGIFASKQSTKYLIVTDKSFKGNGQLFYPDSTSNPNFKSWVPEFYGNTILVNGVLWPKMTLPKTSQRFVLLNACQSRFLNVYFENNGNRININLIRVDGDFYDSPVTVTQFLSIPSSRIQFVLDLTNVNGQIIMKNNAAAPYPNGNPENLNPIYTGQIMKILVQNSLFPITLNQVITIPSFSSNLFNTLPSYPAFLEGEKKFITLFEVLENDMPNAIFIDGRSLNSGKDCANSTFNIGRTYDFYFANLTPDTHPIHFHLINMQKVKQFPFNVTNYSANYFAKNGGRPGKNGFNKHPTPLDPTPYRTGADQMPKPQQKVFRDTIECPPEYVTVMRIKFAKNDGTKFTSMNLANQRFVFHCHMLEHQDNEMMKYFCLK